uniref:Uncharacterized protein n=1 Tax=Solanum lycopersicum TaxID=4081 RepID=A0A3Q7HVH5_SOLLC
MPKKFCGCLSRLCYAASWPSQPIKTSKIPNFFVDVRQYLCYAARFPSRPIQLIFKVIRIPTSKMPKKFCGRLSRPWLCIQLAITASPTLFQDSDVKNPKKNCGCPSRPCLCSRLAFTASLTHFEGQMSPEANIPQFRRFSCAIANHFLAGWLSRPVQPILNVKRALKQAYPSFRRFSCAIANHFLASCPSRPIQLIFKVIRIPTSKMPKNFVDVRQDLVYAVSCPSRPVRPIFKGHPDCDVKNSKKNCRRSSRPWLCSQLAITSTLNHFQGQTSPEARIPLFRRFLCAIANNFLGYPDSDVKNAKNFVDVRQDLVYAAGWPSRPVRPILKVTPRDQHP